MKNKKGFTLVEVLAIIIILAVITVVAAPNITKQIKNSEDATQNILDTKIENASKLYAAKYYADKIVTCASDDECAKFKLEDLEKDGLLRLADSECKSGGATISGDIIVKNVGGYIKFDYSTITSNCHSCEDNGCVK